MSRIVDLGVERDGVSFVICLSLIASWDQPLWKLFEEQGDHDFVGSWC
jgi:hypothetical protein